MLPNCQVFFLIEIYDVLSNALLMSQEAAYLLCLAELSNVVLFSVKDKIETIFKWLVPSEVLGQ